MDIVYSEQGRRGSSTSTGEENGERTEMLVTCIVLVEGVLQMTPEHVSSVLQCRGGGGVREGSASATEQEGKEGKEGKGLGNESDIASNALSLTDVLLCEPSQRVRDMLSGLLSSVVAIGRRDDIIRMMELTIGSLSLTDSTTTCNTFFTFLNKQKF